MKTLVLDTCGWVFATKLGLNKLLQKYFKLVIPPSIEKEVREAVKKKYRDGFIRSDMIKEGIVKVIKVKKKTISFIKSETGLRTEGDLEVLALAVEQKGIVYSDDPHLETGCIILNLPLITTVSIIIYFWKMKKLKTERCLTMFELLEKFGYSTEALLEAKKIIGVI